MKFTNEVIRFTYAGIPMVGNFATGHTIGLTDEGARVCDDLLVKEVDESEIAAVDQALLEHLILGGFFTPRTQSDTLKSAYIHVTQRCNLKCAGCYSDDEKRNILEDASLPSLFHALQELARGGVEELVISGGEPFLRDDLPDLVEYAKKECGIKVVKVLSNGTCLDEGRLKKLTPYVDCVSVSFDVCSPDSISYVRNNQHFTELVDAVKAIKKAGIPSHIIATIHKNNIDDMQQYSILADDLGVTLNFSLLSCPVGSEDLGELTPNDEDLKKLADCLFELGNKKAFAVLDAPISLNLSIKHRCGAGKTTISVGADGKVYPCHMMHSDDLVMGNLFSDRIEEVMQSKNMASFNSLSVEDFDDCRSCDYQWICGGGCRARALSSFGSISARDGFCSMVTQFYGNLGKKLQELYVSK